MYLRSIRLRDWKAYATAVFDFPTPTSTKSVVLIGAKNGYGKTSLLEALILGLYGRDGMDALARAVTTGDAEKSYDEFLERALHAHALEQGRTSISIEIVLEDEQERLKVVRKWHFTPLGRHRRDQEDVQLYDGPDEEPVRPPGGRLSRDERDDAIRGLIARKFIPFHLTEFFLFDGERVQQLAKQQKADTVKMGIEGVLGVQLLRELQQDLVSYAQDRRRGVERVGDDTLTRLNDQMGEIEARLGPTRGRLKELEDASATVGQRIAELTRTVQTMTGGSLANVQELMAEQFRFRRLKDKIEDELNAFIRTDLAFALAGKPLRDRVLAGIRRGIVRSEWRASKAHAEGQLDRILAGLDADAPPVQPPLTETQTAALRQRIRTAWESLWHSLPADSGGPERHSYLAEAERRRVIERLDRLERLGVTELHKHLEDHEDAATRIDNLTREIAQLSGVEDRIRDVTAELQRLNQQAGELREQSGALARQEQADASELSRLRAEAGRMQARHESTQPQVARAAKAERIAGLISDAIADLYPRYVGRLGAEMTAVYKQLAHKTLVKRIEIAPDCTVRMLGDKDRDVRTMDASAGEEQIFALSLIAAIAKVSGTRVPIVMDTPLARLDTDHRSRVLRYFATEAAEQVIFLSQPDEVHGPYRRAIKDRVGKEYHVEFEELDNGVGKAHVRAGYFPTEEG